MTFNIDTFKSAGLVDGGARPALFEVRLTALPLGTTLQQTQVSFLATAASLPAAALGVIEVPYMGRRIKLYGERSFDPWTITIMNDEDFAIRDMFEAWSNKMNAMISNRQDSPPDDLMDYKADGVEALQYGKDGPGDDSGVIRGYQFYGCWPSNVRDIALDWARGNQIETFDVTLAYDYWIPTTIGKAVPTFNGILNPA